MRDGRFLNLHSLSMEEFARVQNGWNSYQFSKCPKYFGYVDKKELKKLNRLFGYVDGASWISGACFGALGVGLYLCYKKAEKEINDETEEKTKDQ